MTRSALRLACVVAAATLVATACSSSGASLGGTSSAIPGAGSPGSSAPSSPGGAAGAGSSTAGAGSSTAGGGGSTAPSFTLNVGDVLPFTGDLSTYGPSLDKGARLGADMINEALQAGGAPGAKVAIVGSEDDQTSTSAGVEAATKLVQSEHAQVLIGSMSSGVTIAIAQSVAIPNNVIMMTPTSSDPSISDLKDNGLVFRVYPPDNFQAQALAKAMAAEFGATATLNVGGRNDAFGVALVQSFTKQWEKQGGHIGQSVMYNPTAATFDTDAAKLASGNPAGWMIADFPTTFAKMGPALVRTGSWDPHKTYMTEAMQNVDGLKAIGAPATDGLRGTAASATGGTDPAGFETLFKQKEPGAAYTGFEATSFDSVVIAGLAALKAGSSDPTKVKAALLTVSQPTGEKFTWKQLPDAVKAVLAGKTIDYQGAWTNVAFGSKGDPQIGTFVVWEHAAGKINNLNTFQFQD